MERLEARLPLDASDLLDDFYVCSFDHDHDDEFHVASVRHDNGLMSLSPDDRIVAPSGSLGSLDDGSVTLFNSPAGLPQLNSRPGAPTAIYLDFDGHEANGAFDRDGAPTTFDAAEAATIVEAHRQTSVFFAMFDVNVTTVKPTVPFAWLVISNDIEGGFSSVNVFPNSQPRSWINSSSAESRITGLVHEIGHNFGLYHQSDYDADGNLTSEYSNGLDALHGALMGVDYRRDVQKWFIGHPNNSASRLQDDVAVIADVIKRYQPTGGDGFRADDHGGTLATATTLTAVAGGRSASGIIERMTDVDMFSFTTTGTGAVISVVPTKPSGLDAKLEVFDASGALVAASDGAANEQQLILPLGTGTWYVSVSSAGNYGDLGLYDLAVNDLPAGWTSADVGDIDRLPGDATFSAGTYTVAGAGARVGSTADAFRFVWQTLNGDGSIVARVTQNQATNPGAKAGVMIRESLAANSKHVAMVTTASQGPQLISRSATGGESAVVGSGAAAFAPTWVRLVRAGNVITAARSADGVSWVTVGSVTVAMSATVRIGLLTSAQDATKVNTARFTDVSLTGTLNPPEAVNGLAPPADVSVRQGGGASLVVRWKSVAGATEYQIERSVNGVDFSSVFTATDTATSWTDLGLPGALRYFYRVRALAASSRSAASTVVSEVNRSSPVTNASIAPMSNTQLILNWRDTSGETGYRIERSTDNTTFTQIATLAANVPSYTAGGLTAGTPYWFRISPMTATGDGNPVVVSRTTSGTQSVTELAFTSKSSTAIGIEWTAVASATNYRIQRSQNGSTFTTLATVPAGTLAYSDATVAVLGKYYYQVVAINGTTVADPSPTIFTAAPRTTPLPAPWTAADIGSVAGEGATGLQSDKFILVSSGTAIGGPADSFRFTSQPLVGNGSIVTRVSLQDTTGGWAKAGVMIRESTDVNARQAVMVVSPTKGIAWQYRHNIGGSGVTSVVAADRTAPVWLKLERAGNRFTGSWSSDGVTWTEAGSTTVSMGPTAVIGLVSTSDDATRLNRAEFADVTVAAAPALAASGTFDAIATVLGTASSTTAVAVTGTKLTGTVVATAPAGFEVSSDGMTFGSTAAFTPTGGAVSGTLAVRLAATTATGTYSGTVSIASAGAATLAVAVPASTVTDEVIIDVAEGQTVTRSVGQTGAVKFVKRGLGTLVLDAASVHTGTTTVEAGTLVVAVADAVASSAVIVRPDATLKVNAGVTMRAPSLTVAGGTLDGTGTTIRVDATSGLGVFAITSGSVTGSPRLTVSGGGVFTLPNDRRQTVALAALTVDHAAGGRLDIGRGRIDIAVGGIVAGDLRAALVSGRNGNAFNGTSGIMTTGGKATASAAYPAVGYRVLSSGAAVVAWAAYGDANLDGQVNLTDVNLLNAAGKYGQGPATNSAWAQGDFNYSGGVTLTDINLVSGTAVFGAGTYLPIVPEAASPERVSMSQVTSTAPSTPDSTAISWDTWIAFALQADTEPKKKA